MIEGRSHFTNHENKNPHVRKTKFLIELRLMSLRAGEGANRRVSQEVSSRFFREQSRKFGKNGTKMCDGETWKS